MARTEDLTISQSTDAKIKLFIENPDGTAMDLNGKQFSASMKKRYTDATSIDFTVDVVEANTGIVTLSLSSAQTAALENARYVYDVMMYEAGNTDIREVLSGKVLVKPTVTRVG